MRRREGHFHVVSADYRDTEIMTMSDPTETQQSDIEDQRTQADQPPPGGGATRGPSTKNIADTFDPDAVVPPYEDRSTGVDSVTGIDAQESAGLAYDASNAEPPGPGREESAEERAGVPGTDTTAASPLGVGVSKTDSAEDIAEDTKEGTKGQSERPYGKSGAGEESGLGR